MSKEFLENKLNLDPQGNLTKLSKNLAKHADVKQNQCFICKNKKSKKDCNIFGIDYVICENCSHTYVKKRLSTKALSKFYEEETAHSNIYADSKALKLRQKIVEDKIDFIKKFANGKNWLDVGSAEGSSIEVCKKKGFNAVGIELNENSRKFAKKKYKIDLYPNSLEEFAKENKTKWDVISFFGVLEHIPEPMKALKICNSLLKKNGIIAILVPNYNSISTYVQKLTKLPNRHLLPHSHIMLFSEKSLKTAVKKSGFKPHALWIWGSDTIELLKYMQSVDRNFLKSQLGKTMISNINDIQQIFDKEKSGDEMLMISKKI
jgi:2-polyprenyl-3-methyl-5-hydroxy-6-metoxy-1,4-benzoquinol methylase